jgi:hypothetical protein
MPGKKLIGVEPGKRLGYGIFMVLLAVICLVEQAGRPQAR